MCLNNETWSLNRLFYNIKVWSKPSLHASFLVQVLLRLIDTLDGITTTTHESFSMSMVAAMDPRFVQDLGEFSETTLATTYLASLISFRTLRTSC
jgi:hypothetical protein